MPKTAILYHEVKPGIPCADGIAAAWVASKKYPEATLIGASYGADLPEVAEFSSIIIVDFSFPIQVLQGWEADNKTVLVIDHHKTAMADLSGFSNAIFDMAESGASLTWKHFFPDQPCPPFIQYVADRDLYNFNLPYTQEIHEASGFIGRNLSKIEFLCGLSQEDLLAVLRPLGEKLLEPIRQRIAELSQTAEQKSIKGYNVQAVEVKKGEGALISDLCTAIYHEHTDCDFVVAYGWNEDRGVWTLSLRSDRDNGDFDVSAIAKQFNGGGHRNASGAAVASLAELFD